MGVKMKKLFATLAVMSAFVSAPVAAQGIPCAPRERMLEIVIDRLGGVRQATGSAGQGAQMELFASDGGEWWFILHLPDGRACLLGNGIDFEPTGGLQPARGNPT
jgi:hypothetical protein